ncbi:uncharacterized protein ATC70_001278 [Mucor velutinosus]|uniref:Uncharacterized protein n=1 Tax=Mucor velutinosus TaxID=708070 RepID=A0AAN7DK67_9FUNG|nr:hypothetical protein ATC70_001278 [Mucor velutinosus]
MHFCNTSNTTLNTHNMTPCDELDERWDGNLGYYHPSNLNERQKEFALESLSQQSCSINQPSTAKETSPPLSAKSDGSISTACFREVLDDSYLQSSSPNSPVIRIDTVPTPLTTPPLSIATHKQQEVDYLTTYKDDEDEDLSIVSLNDLSPNECIAALNQQEEQDANCGYAPTPPASLLEYHQALVNHYIDALLRKTDPHTISPAVMQSIEATLPPMYQTYISLMRKSFSVPYPCL